MKAHYTEFINKQQRDMYARKIEEMQQSFAILYEKLLIYTLHNVYGYGIKRIQRLVEELNNGVDEMHSNPVFWGRIDKDVIDNLGFDYPRCDCEIMEKTFYRPPEIPAEEKRKVFSEMQRMREFLQKEVNGDD